MKRFFTLLAVTIATISCDTENLNNDAPAIELHTESVSVRVAIPADGSTRVAVADDSEGGYNVEWSKGDALGGWCDGVYYNSTFNAFAMDESSFSANSATFTGDIQYADNTDNMRFVYPYSSSTTLYNKDNTINGYTTYMNAFDISLSAQSAKVDLSHLNATTYMVSDAIAYAYVESEIPVMHHVGAVMDLNLKLNSSQGYALVKVVVSGMPTDATINLIKEIDDADFLTLSSQSGSYEIAVDSFEANDDIYSLAFNMLPFTLAAGSSISVEATFADSTSAKYTSTATYTATSAVEFERATRNTLNLILADLSDSESGDGSGELTEIEYVFDYDALGTSWLNDTEKSLDGIDWYIDGMKNSGDYGNIGFSYYNSVGGSCYNKTAFGAGVTEIIVDIKSGTDLALYAGTAQNPTSNAITPSVSGTVYTYTLDGDMPYIRFKNNSTDYVNLNSLIIKYMGDASTDGNTGDDDDDYDVDIPAESNGTAYNGWAELPSEISDSGNLYYAYHTVDNGSATVRNFGACYSNDYTCPVWVAGPMHSSYTGSASRTDAYADDPQIDCYQVETLGSPYNRGHMIASSDRTASTAMNKQAFYLSNIAPQLLSYFNSGGGIWNNYEDYIQDQYESRTDTLYIVNGCHWENTNTVVSGTTVPTHYYKAVLRTKQAGSSKWVGNCTEEELECVAFYFEHKSSQEDPQSSHMISISDLEKKTGWTYFENVPNAPKDSFTASDWDL